MTPKKKSALPVELIRRHAVLPLREDEKGIHLAVGEPLSPKLQAELEFFTGKKVTSEIREAAWVAHGVENAYGAQSSIAELVEQRGPGGKSEAGTEAITTTQVQVLDFILAEALRKRATDVHLERHEKAVRLRLRIDGILHGMDAPPVDLFESIISRIKVISGLDIGEKRLPQDGKFTLTADGNPVDIRVSLLPGFHGEACVLRILNQKAIPLELGALGFYPEHANLIKDVLASPHGLILVSGSTGSGKSTTLHAMVQALDCEKLKVISIEDPVEIHAEKILQIQVKPEIGFTFAEGLRSILRHDPEVILVGEIRDRETAEMAIRSAITGHLVLCTVHANDNQSAISRLIDLGVDRKLLSEALRILLHQELERKICPHCKDTVRGCAECSYTGYLGRTVIYEIVPVAEELREAVVSGVTSASFWDSYLGKHKIRRQRELLERKKKEGLI